MTSPKKPPYIGYVESERDWPEDFPHENGCYMNRCIQCNQMFTGHKRRQPCKVCYNDRDKGSIAFQYLREQVAQRMENVHKALAK